MDPDDPSPLHRFVVAKRSIGSIFDQLLEFVKNGSAFVDEAVQNQDLGPVAVEEQNLEMQSCANKLAAIREVLLRRTMKVAFFGRTSNGKSTVINAMLRERVLPSGIGHTTNCFLSVEGTDAAEPYLTTEASAERHAVSTVNQLAHALHMDPALDSGSLVRVFWPKNRCALLRDDLVLMDSPGTDVTLELDSWIDKFCLDADVFVLVGNAESTLMNTEFISQSAVRTKFEQHTVRAWQITEAIKTIMDAINIASADRKICCLEEREEQRDRLDFVRGQMSRLSDSVKNRIGTLTDDVTAKVAAALLDQIQFLPVLVEEFRADFSPTPENLELYKAKLVQHLEQRLSGGLAHRCHGDVLRDIRDAQRLMTDSVRPLVSPSVQQQLCAPSSSFEMTFDLSLAALCADFREDIDFRFSLGWSALVTRFIGAHRALAVPEDGPTLKDRLVVSMATSLVSVSSRASMAVLLIGGVVWRSVGWRVVALSVSLYGLLYLYERLTWTASSQERALKQQFTEFAAFRLRAVVPVTSSACSQQVFKELTSTFSRLTQRVDLSEAELEGRIRQLTCRIQRLEATQRKSKAFRNRATELETQLEAFSARYLQAAD
ncbi:mitofusin-1-like isoform X3 [Poeciliopsis prolifica]|uniref:mitofusin-1-like isoform X3 n=1 Tax=Poeciliopsis prolifica TaxID=188132 RepID=UPI0024141E27|nr:mitofusin-1-like isoform X3 [Poeciliopsis prolifica]